MTVKKGLVCPFTASLTNVLLPNAVECTHVPFRDSKLTRMLQSSLVSHIRQTRIQSISSV